MPNVSYSAFFNDNQEDLQVDNTQSSSFSASAGYIHPLDVSGGAITVTPPAAPVSGDLFMLIDLRSASSANPITVDFTLQKVRGQASNFVIQWNGVSLMFRYLNATEGWDYSQGQTSVSAGTMVGTTAVTSGSAGAAPQPLTSDFGNVLFADGSYQSSAPDWQASRYYNANNMVYFSGQLLRRKTPGTSGLVYDSTENLDWYRVGSSPWAAYTPSVIGSALPVTLPAVHTIRGLYQAVGKTLSLSFEYFAESGAGGTSAAGIRLITLPPGVVIDAGVVNFYAPAAAGSNYGAQGTPLGHGFVSNDGGVYMGTATVYAYNATQLCVQTMSHTAGQDIWGGFWYTLSTNHQVLSFTANIPISAG